MLPPRGVGLPGQKRHGKIVGHPGKLIPGPNGPIPRRVPPIANGKILKPKQKLPIKKAAKRPHPNANKYVLEKPWVNDEIKEAHDKKVDLENQLKGKKNDEIFAEFKVQRDKFVALYDAAKAEYIAKKTAEVNIS